MTTVQTMLRIGVAVRTLLALACAVVAVVGAPGCGSRPDLVAPEALLSPYDAATGETLWAVAPLANESGAGIVDVLAVCDAIVGKVTEAQGLSAVPMNRTIAAMRSLSMPAVRSPAEARMLAEALGVDGIIVGSITAYDPYNPPTIGLTLALYTRPPAPVLDPGPSEDPRAMRAWPTDPDLPRTTFSGAPSSVVVEHLPGVNHAVQMNVRRYAQGRHRHDSALGWERYLASMELYTDFAAHWVVRRLLEEERLRLARTGGGQVGLSR